MTSAAPITGFSLLRLLGRGNSAWVHLAVDEQGRRVALKLPFPETLADPESAERFANEVRLSLQLRHERLVIGHTGVAFGPGTHLAMRYFPEGTLSRWLEMGKLTTSESLGILADLAGALTYLHAQGVVHQDVKSQNVYLDSGRAALGDFGSAYFTTQGGKTAGSPFYMAPEIYRAEGSSPASDVYSLGILAYEMLTHERPFRGSTYEQLMAAHLASYPRPLVNQAPEVPRPLALLLERAFAKSPQERPDAPTLLRALEGALGRAPETGPFTPVTAAANPVVVGRHGPTTRGVGAASTLSSPEKPDRENKPAFWNPFKKR
ncbi:serine/threonine-protein kinase [Deinococcus peraridilitoris]|uniref:Protein kinase family protein n=1 Tax=Deinococcus peraridilitoris (strain DSM 19664 / LMG 22246 / CIP 109416 / KR-200) TaxID=937777 RepID=K9ZYJ4_DEIPD|nr:serine/threonine-protein kinase [Deinococcus peraridilitoris]AFZ66641.1 protein kinase family protein [Deinococcus peraridilitoris DSM 19664]